MFHILYIHTDFIVINKHPGVSVHKDDGETMLLQEVSKTLDQQPLYLVHRLDKMTSGLLLLARSSSAARLLSEAFAHREIEKYYIAIGAKKPKKKQGVVCGDMARTRRSAWKLMPSQDNPAVTQFFSTAGEPGERIFLCRPRTGKTHQIRVALKSLGSAIVGDPTYNASHYADRGYLHAYALVFSLRDETFRFVCDPRNFELFGVKWSESSVVNAIEEWAEPWLMPWPEIK